MFQFYTRKNIGTAGKAQTSITNNFFQQAAASCRFACNVKVFVNQFLPGCLISRGKLINWPACHRT
jgi:hypothetical protein